MGEVTGMAEGTAEGAAELAEVFEAERVRLVLLAQRLLGVRADAEDAVQEGWLRLQRHGGKGIDSHAAWLTTVVSRLCLDGLQARTARESRTTSWDVVRVLSDDGRGPAEEAEIADSVGLALIVVLDALTPAERVALVLHDVFGVPFEEVAAVLGRSRDATKMAASRARQKVRGRDVDIAGPAQRRVVDAFRAAARDGDIDALLQVLDPAVQLHADTPAGRVETAGADAVARRASLFAGRAGRARAVLVGGLAGLLAYNSDGTPRSLVVFTVKGARIVHIDTLADPAELRRMTFPD